MPSPAVTLTGTLLDFSGNPMAGTVTLTLPSYGLAPIFVAGTGLVASPSITAQAADDGTFSITFYGNYQLSEPGTTYTLSVTAPGSNQPAWEAQYQFTAAGSYNLSTLEPVPVPGTYATVNGSRVYFVGPRGLSGGGTGIGGSVFFDTVTNIAYQMTVVSGALTMTPVATVLIDTADATHYQLVVTSGALTLTAVSSSIPGLAELDFTDPITQNTFALRVTNGTLTLTTI